MPWEPWNVLGQERGIIGSVLGAALYRMAWELLVSSGRGNKKFSQGCEVNIRRRIWSGEIFVGLDILASEGIKEKRNPKVLDLGVFEHR